MNGSMAVFACSGPGAAAAIQQNIRIGYFAATSGAVVILAMAYDAIRTRRWGWTLPLAAFMLLIHPAWMVSAVHGDCGYFKRDASYFFTAAYLLLLAYQLVVSAARSSQESRNDSKLSDPSEQAQGLGTLPSREPADLVPNPYKAPQSPLGD